MTAVTRPPAREGSGTLKKNTIGAFGLTFMVVAAAAPLTAMASNISLSLAFGVGAGTVGLLLLVAGLLAVFGVAFIVLSRRVTNAGAYYSYIGHGLGPTTGAGAAFVAAIAYNLAAGGMIAATGYFASATVSSYLGVELPWWAFGVLALGIVAVLGYRGVEVTQRLTTSISLLQFVMIGALGVAIALQRPQGWSIEVFSPQVMLDGNIAMTLVFCVLSFVGFEATAIYGEEAKAGAKSIRIATYASIGLLAAVFVFSTWSVVAASPDVQAEAIADPGSLIFRVADLYLGTWSGGIISALVTVSFLAAAVAFHNMAARYHFALGRSGLLPAVLGTTSARHRTPWAASRLQLAISAIMLIPFVLVGADPIINLFPAVSGITSVSLISLMIGCCASVLVARFRFRWPDSVWSTVVAPAVAGVGLIVILVIVIANYSAVTGSDALIVALMPLIPLAGAIYGALAYRARGRGSELEANL